ncbi:hypothetical protein F511_32645 [Dorcoceras hygrometricum]|uniref:Uncharacterized protein n=1 Tax=Dorcoceras hygrometricum TaxID=472368 RepID=A0A2Z7B8L5_9LAMI|nr:hypothetical protein F511_32645 [Dorcoceras hygrometricum]
MRAIGVQTLKGHFLVGLVGAEHLVAKVFDLAGLCLREVLGDISVRGPRFLLV